MITGGVDKLSATWRQSISNHGRCNILGGSWVVINGVISMVTILITHIRGLITPLITTHEPPSIASKP